MSRTQIVVAALAGSALLAALLAISWLRWEIVSGEQRLDRSLAENQGLRERLRLLEVADNRTDQQLVASNLDCPVTPAQCPAPRETIITPDGRRLSSPEERTEFVRTHLSERLASALLDGQLEEDQRHGALDLLMIIRELRITGQSAEELERAQQELFDLTGMGVGDLLETIEDSASRSRRPADAPPIEDGDLRKRFPDEMSRQLGITVPGLVERNQDGAWEADELSRTP